MKVTEIFTESQHKEPEKKKQSMAELIERLKKAGGEVYSKITHGTENGWLGYNGKGTKKVYFAFYPDGDMQRFEKPVVKRDLKIGWTAVSYDDPETVLKDKKAAEKISKEEEREAKFEETVRFGSFEEMRKIAKKNGIDIGTIVDEWVESDTIRKIGGRWVAYTTYSITTKNEDFDPKAPGENGHDSELHDPFYITFYRDSKDPEKIHATY